VANTDKYTIPDGRQAHVWKTQKDMFTEDATLPYTLEKTLNNSKTRLEEVKKSVLTSQFTKVPRVTKNYCTT
jgi:hypothetical protein